MRLESTINGVGSDTGATVNAGGIGIGYFGSNDIRMAIGTVSNIPITFRSTTGALDSATSELLRITSSGSIYTTNWTNVSFGSGWSNYLNGYQTVQYKKVGDLVFLETGSELF